MQDYIYSVIAFLAMVIHLIINSNHCQDRVVVAARGSREYRVFLYAVFAYYVVDAGWGVFAGLGWTNVLYVDTMLYYIAIAMSVLTSCRYFSVYLNLGKWKARMLVWFGYALLSLYVVLLTANVFNGCLFIFDEQGRYTAGLLRALLFYPLVVMSVLMAICAFVKACRSHNDSVRRQNMVAFLFCFTMAVAIVLQIVWPLWPYYALGCLIGNCFFNVFAIEDEREELRHAIIEREQTAKHAAELEKALVRARAAEKSRSMFFSIVSHDIRTPLNAILGYAELLQSGLNSQAEKEEALNSIRSSGTTLLQLVNDVLDLAKLDAGKMTLRPEPMLLSQLTDDVFSSFRLVAVGKGIELVNKTADVPKILLDGHRVRQILFNLIGNAVKFTERGSVTVSASYVRKHLEVSVSDTGCGIPSDMLAHILDPFVQVHDPSHSAERTIGTGLGLSICRSLVEMMGGELVVESELGKGSTFRAAIPGVELVEESTAAVPEQKATVDLKNLPKRVLVVDDSRVNRAVLTAFLKKVGVASIKQAVDGEEALSELDSAFKAGSPFDFVFSDFWMPNMNGLELIEKLRADSRFKRLSVFALTADTETNQDARANLFTGILLKPTTYNNLVTAFASAS